MVPKIDEIGSNLNLQGFLKQDLFHQPEVPKLKRRTTERVASQISAARHGVGQNVAVPIQRLRDDSGAVDSRVEGSQIVSIRIHREDSVRIVVRTARGIVPPAAVPTVST